MAKRSSSEVFSIQPDCSCTNQSWHFNHRWVIAKCDDMLYRPTEIPNHKCEHILTSQVFPDKSPNSIGGQWELQLKETKEETDSTTCMGITLKYDSMSDDDFVPSLCKNIRCIFYIVTSDGRLIVRAHEKRVSAILWGICVFSVGHWMNKNELLDPRNKYMDEGKLTILCEVIHIPDNCQKVKKQRTSEGSNLGEDFLSALKLNMMSDVTIKTKFGKSFPAHRLVLSARSSVFAAMFSANLKESSSGELYLDETNAQVEALLEYMYAEKLPENISNSEMLMMADKYNIRSLQNDLETILMSELNLANATEMLRMSDMYNADRLKERTLLYMKANFKFMSMLRTFRETMKVYQNLAAELLLIMLT